ncbi:MAG TPA: hypothetical protein VIH99_10020, partial [Bdellovibrionota bacterium]
MKSRIFPDIELVFAQLLWLERRRFRIVESVGMHFGRSLVEKVLGEKQLLNSPLSGEPSFHSLL